MKVPGVLDAKADMSRHTVTVVLADEAVKIESVVAALHDAGFAVKEPVVPEREPGK